MLHGSAEQGLIARISYTEFTLCGQPGLAGKDCINFHMTGDASKSLVTGNSIHHTFARGITLEGTSYLTVKLNVGYLISGHNIFLKDGIEQYNSIENNLMISSLQAFDLLQTDLTVASYYVSNPLNVLKNNRAAGSDYYGFLYHIKAHPTGGSATADICPVGLPVSGGFQGNSAHSNKKIGFKISQLLSSQNPCKPIRNDAVADPWSVNPSVQNKF